MNPEFDPRTELPQLQTHHTIFDAYVENEPGWDGEGVYTDLETAQRYSAAEYVRQEWGTDSAGPLTWRHERSFWDLLDDGKATGVIIAPRRVYAAPSGSHERPAGDLAHAAEDLRKHLDLRARAVNDEVLIHPEVLSVARADGHSHALMESVVRTLLAERDALAAYVDRLATPDDDAIHSAAILRDWFKSEGSLAMDEEDLNHVQTVLADYEHIVAGPTVTASQPDEQPQDDEVQHARTFLAGLRENITGYHQPLPGQPEHCTCGGASGCDRGADDLAAIATLEAALNTAAPQYTVDGLAVDRESYEAWADEGRERDCDEAGIYYDEHDDDEDGGPF